MRSAIPEKSSLAHKHIATLPTLSILDAFNNRLQIMILLISDMHGEKNK
jgi:hypothetical protein